MASSRAISTVARRLRWFSGVAALADSSERGDRGFFAQEVPRWYQVKSTSKAGRRFALATSTLMLACRRVAAIALKSMLALSLNVTFLAKRKSVRCA